MKFRVTTAMLGNPFDCKLLRRIYNGLCGVSDRNGWPGVKLLLLGDIASLI